MDYLQSGAALRLFGGIMSVFSYLATFLIRQTGFPAVQVTMILALYGVADIVGNLVLVKRVPNPLDALFKRLRHRCRGMQEALRQLFRHAGLPALSSRDARRTVAGLLYDQGADESQVGLLLGIRDNSAVRALLIRPRPSLVELTQCLL